MKRSRLLSSLLLLVLLVSVGCNNQPALNPTAFPHEPVPTVTNMPPTTLTVLAAASLTEAFTEIGTAFEALNPGARVEFSFAGSQQLAQQIEQGAPADVFASASKKYMDAAVKSGRITEGNPDVFANNRLVVIFPKDNPAGLAELKDLAKPGLKLVLAAIEVPVGQYSLDFLDKAISDPAYGQSFKEDVLKNVVSYEENVKAVLAKVALNEADAGIVYLSDISGDAVDQVDKLDIPDPLNVIAIYPIAALKDSQNPALAQGFVDFVLSPAGQALIEKYNFIPVVQP
jgi:molybdate transport system substrate-binding protein